MRDETSGKQVKRVISPVSVSDNMAQVGQIIDHLGYDAATYIINTGSIADADATFAVLLEEGDLPNLSGSNEVADGDMVSEAAGAAPETAAAFRFDDDNEVRRVGYIVKKRYTRLTITPSGNASAAVLSACCILERARVQPVTQGAS